MISTKNTDLLLSVGKGAPREEALIFSRYQGRLRRNLQLIEIPEGKGGSTAEIRQKEGQALLARMPEDVLFIALDARGEALSSEAFAKKLLLWRERGKRLGFIIGGAEGLAPEVLNRVFFTLSLGKMILPHFLVRVLLAEALYRAQCIQEKHPYHRS